MTTSRAAGNQMTVKKLDSRIGSVPAAARHVVISVNPKAGAKSGASLVEQLEGSLSSRGYESTVVNSVQALQTTTAEKLAANDLRAIVCAGGDGTLAFVANLVAPEASLAILPLGTENLFAKYLGIAADPESIAAMIDDGHVCHFDAGLAKPVNSTPPAEAPSSPPNIGPSGPSDAKGRIFTLMVGVGFDADVVRQVHEGRTGHIRHWTYAKPIWSTIRTYKYPKVSISTDQGERLSARWVFIANLPRYAGNLQVVPDACGWNGKLTICTFKSGSLWMGLQYLAAVFFRRHRDWKSEVRMVEAERIRVASESTVSYQLDGDYGGVLPLDIDVLPGRLRMLVPHAWLDQQHGSN